MSTSRPHIIVGGLARCGTTLMMHMLHAGGIPCIGTKPDFEVEEVNHRQVDPAFLARHPGHALKLLDPHETPLPVGTRAVLIWLDRDPDQQARSQAKFVRMTMSGIPMPNRSTLRRWAAGLRGDRAKALARFPGWPRLELKFEAIITGPETTAHQIAGFLCQWWPDLDVERMAAQVRPRPTDCAPDLAIELALSEEAEFAA